MELYCIYCCGKTTFKDIEKKCPFEPNSPLVACTKCHKIRCSVVMHYPEQRNAFQKLENMNVYQIELKEEHSTKKDPMTPTKSNKKTPWITKYFNKQ